MYDVEPHVAEIYDQVDTHTDDVEFLRGLVGDAGPLRVLEPFCGTGRILIPLALDGHTVVGIDQARSMLDRAAAKVEGLPDEARERITLIRADVTSCRWPSGFDLVVLGGNCFYELATPTEQEGCVASAAAALRPSGHVFVDNDHMEGELDASWQRHGVSGGFPSGVCADGARLEGTGEAVWWDARRRLVRFRRRTRVALPDGTVVEREFIQQKHPVSTAEVRSWLTAHGLAVVRLCGDYDGAPYTDDSERAIFWAEKR
jgi:SAM-dependent methyltransferase